MNNPPPLPAAPAAALAAPSPDPGGLLAWLHAATLAGNTAAAADDAHGGVAAGLALNPYARDVFLLACHVVGIGYCGLEDLFPALGPGRPVRLQREPDHPHDSLAILVLDAASGRRLGYVSRPDNPVLARLMDAGKTLVAELGDRELRGGWHRLELRISLREL